MGIIIPCVVIVAAVLGLWLVYRRKDFDDLGLSLFLCHAGVISGFAAILYFPIRDKPEASLAWALFVIADFPASLLLIFLGYLFGLFKVSMSSMMGNWFFPYLALLLLGSSQYYLVGKWIHRKSKSKANKTI